MSSRQREAELETSRRTSLLIVVLGAVTTLLHLLTAKDSYGLFRDELYYLANGAHLGFGYVDHPPMIALAAWFSRTVFGESMLAVRTLPALSGGASVIVAAWLTRELGGNRFAQFWTGLCTALAPLYVGHFGYLSMNAFDVLIWCLAAAVLARLIRTGEERLWLAFGVVAGIGLQNKLSIVFLALGVVAGLLLAGQWRRMTTRDFWLGGAIAFAIFLPNLIWQVAHGFPTLEFMRNATLYKNLPLAPGDFLLEQLTMMNPIAALAGLAGLAFYFTRGGRTYRALGLALLVIVMVMITQRAKAYYLGPAYPLLWAPGAVMVERLASRPRWGWLRGTATVLLVATGLMLAPLAKPMLPVETHVSYMEALGVAPSTDERKQVGRLPQFFADRLGWRELAQTVAEVFEKLNPEERDVACVYGQNYGQAGAIDFYGPDLGLPPAISGHNSYWLWGPGDCSGEVLIIISGDREDHERSFARVEEAARYTCDDCMPYEAHKTIWICRGLNPPLRDGWARTKHYD
jgi:4-amino-4-deoxy-L-arabinose transferase-like glycosyltransferase